MRVEAYRVRETIPQQDGTVLISLRNLRIAKGETFELADGSRWLCLGSDLRTFDGPLPVWLVHCRPYSGPPEVTRDGRGGAEPQ